ncbi:MAG TPA: DUF4870 domain-containing protein [Brevibacterium senegalense]|uniref:DUF4870 domain-containing protein n=1 Tax=Brevibacterium senegalense TaxID=1033736 RepID=A0A921SN68_9MICO|nr:DUF4870 domain-containing protein [Brevibacterium senegalense]
MTQPPPVGWQQPGPYPGPQPPMVPRKTGAVAWGLSFLAYIPLPFFNIVITGIVQLCVGLAQRKHGGLAAQNGIRAANWGLTQLTWFVLLALTLAVQFITDPDGTEELTPLAVVAIVLVCVWMLLSILNLVYGIVGLVMSQRGKVAKCPAIPYLRLPRT